MKIRISVADAIYSKLVKLRANNRCERCGVSGGRLECSHRWPRAIRALRWHPDNSDCLCFNCHRWWHSHAAEAGDWLRAQIGRAKYDQLFEAAHRTDFQLTSALAKHIENNLRASLTQMEATGASWFRRKEFANPYDGEVQPIARKPKARKAKPATGRKLQSKPFPKVHRPLRRKVAA